MSDRGSAVREGNSTADRALAILEMFSHERPVLSARELAAGLGVARSTAYRYLQTLVSAGYLREGADGGFQLGGKIVELAEVARGRYHLVDLATPRMRGVAERFGQTVLLTKLVAGTILCVEQEDPPAQFVRLSYRRGGQMAFNAGASALVCVAWLDAGRLDTLLREHPLTAISASTITDESAFRARLAAVREDGYVVTRGEVDVEGMGIGVPVFDSTGAVIAGLSVVGLQTRIAEDDVPRIISALREASAGVTAGLDLYALAR
jgi:DNA-binding IclR family transcriptional regulator